MSSSPNNLTTPSVIRPAGNQDLTLNLLPTRGEKQLIPSPVSAQNASQIISTGFSQGQPTSISTQLSVTQLQDAFDTTLALEPLTDFVTITVQNRGVDSQGNAAPGMNAVYRFLINPSNISISHSTLDSESFARSGWQLGVWGDDFVRISLSGKTPGEYFALGTTDQFAEYTESFRSLIQLEDVFENNGYWFEGEQVNEGVLAAGSSTSSVPSNFTRRTIKMHQDVILAVKEFIWNGMFESLDWEQDANNPFLASFTLSFVAWTEAFRTDSPYLNALPNNVQRGNAYSVYQSLTNPTQTVTPNAANSSSGQTQTALPAPAGVTTATSPAAQSEAVTLPTVIPTGMDYSPTPTVVLNALTTYKNDFLGILG